MLVPRLVNSGDENENVVILNYRQSHTDKRLEKLFVMPNKPGLYNSFKEHYKLS